MKTDAQLPSSRLPAFVAAISIGAIVVTAATLFAIPATLRGVTSSGFLPHRYCYLYNNQLIAVHFGTDALIWLSYVAISCTLVYLVWRTRREIPFSWMFLAFGLFIVACGFTHFMEIVVLWKPLYWLSADIKIVTALASVVTAVALPSLVPKVHEMVSAAGLSEERRQQVEKANTELQHLSARVMNMQDEERRRIARDLHDGVGQYLAAIKMSCGVVDSRLPEGDEKRSMQDALQLLDRCMSEVRTLSHLLHPPLLEEMGLNSAVPWYVQGFTERSGIQVDLQQDPAMRRLPQAVEVALFRVLQESLTNIHRHSGSKTARITLGVNDNTARLRVEDRGSGFYAADGAWMRSGVGIASMRERIRELGGELKVTSSRNGTVVEAFAPLDVAVSVELTPGAADKLEKSI